MNLSQFLDKHNFTWLELVEFDALFRPGFKPTKLKMPLNIKETFLNELTLYSDDIWNKLFDFFTLPQFPMSLMTLGHLYTLDDFAQLR